MNEELKTAITALVKKAAEAQKPDDAMKFAQAALSTAHCLATVDNIKTATT